MLTRDDRTHGFLTGDQELIGIAGKHKSSAPAEIGRCVV
jgi:hypothetical protein